MIFCGLIIRDNALHSSPTINGIIVMQCAYFLDSNCYIKILSYVLKNCQFRVESSRVVGFLGFENSLHFLPCRSSHFSLFEEPQHTTFPSISTPQYLSLFAEIVFNLVCGKESPFILPQHSTNPSLVNAHELE